jgi:hypothetical protein
MKYRRLLAPLLSAALALAVVGCSAEHELPIGSSTTETSLFKKGNLANPLNVQKAPGKQQARQARGPARTGK